MSSTHPGLCADCGSSIEDGYGNRCRSCIESVETHSQTESLIEQTAEALNGENAEEFRAMPVEDQILFCWLQIKKGNIDGGSPGHRLALNRYIRLMRRDLNRAE